MPPLSSDPGDAPARKPLECRQCASKLTVDQRYCIVCGTRARPLPRNIRYALIALARGLRSGTTARRAPEVESPRARRSWREIPAFGLPTPRAAAASILALLAFGVAVGSGAASLASAPLNVVVDGLGSGAHAATTTPPTANASGGGGSGGSGSSTITVTSSPASAASTPASSPTGSGSTPVGSTSLLPPIKHVWVITMGTQPYAKTFSAAGDKYLAKTLAKKGELVSQYFGVTQGELANEIAMISGQGPTPQTETACANFNRVAPGRVTHRDGQQVSGVGCVYPKPTKTLASELAAKHDTWKAYVQGLGAVVKLPPAPKASSSQSTTTATTTTGTTTTGTAAAARAGGRRNGVRQVGTVNAATCRHPVIGTADRFQAASHADPYVTWRDPFVYFRSVITTEACNHDVVGLSDLSGDLKAAATTPSVSFIYADPCDDGSVTPCYRKAPAGLAPANKFLKSIVPQIMGSAAYKAGGLILITFAQAPQTGSDADSSSCCSNPTTYPNVPASSSTSTTSTTSTTTTGTATTGTITSGATSTSTTTTGSTTTSAGTGASSSCTSSGTSGATTTTTATTPSTTTTMTAAAPTTTTSTTTTSTSTTPAGTTPCTVPAGGQVGLLAISPFITPGGQDFLDSFNHFSMLGSIEQLFGLKRLGYAAGSAVPLFGASFYTNYTPA